MYQHLLKSNQIMVADASQTAILPLDWNSIPEMMEEIFAFQGTKAWVEVFRKEAWPQGSSGFGGSSVAPFFKNNGKPFGFGASPKKPMAAFLELAGLKKSTPPSGMAIDRGHKFEAEARGAVEQVLNAQFLPLCLVDKESPARRVSMDGYGFVFDKNNEYAGEALAEIKVPMAKYFDDNYGHLDGFVATPETAHLMGKAYTHGYYHQVQYQLSFTTLDRGYLCFYSPEQKILCIVTVMRDEEVISDLMHLVPNLLAWSHRVAEKMPLVEYSEEEEAFLHEYLEVRAEYEEASPAVNKLKKRMEAMQKDEDFAYLFEEPVPFADDSFLLVAEKKVVTKEVSTTEKLEIDWEAVAKHYLKEQLENDELNLNAFIRSSHSTTRYYKMFGDNEPEQPVQ